MIQKCNGWILDVYIENDEVVLWIKTEGGQVLKLIDDCERVFYIQPRTEKYGTEIIEVLSDLELIKEVRWDYKLVDINSTIKQKLIYVRCNSIHHYNLLLKALQHEILRRRIQQLFNTQLSHIQRYLFTNLRIQPLTKLAIEYEYEDGELVSIDRLSDHEDLESPFSTMCVEVTPFTEQMILDRDDPIKSIRVRYGSDDLILEDNESKVIEDFSNYVISKDPDILVFLNHDLTILHYLLERTRLLSLDLQFGRRKTDIYSVDQRRVLERWTQGRVYLTNSHYDNGLGGLSEFSRFSYLPMRMILQYSIGRLIANRNLYELIGRGYVISDNYNQRTHEHIRTVEEIVDRDKAGMIFSPQIGLHENVAVLDYNDEFANIIVNGNISYETVKNTTQQNKSQLGILPHIVKELLERRADFRQLLKQLPKSSPEANHCSNE